MPGVGVIFGARCGGDVWCQMWGLSLVQGVGVIFVARCTQYQEMNLVPQLTVNSLVTVIGIV